VTAAGPGIRVVVADDDDTMRRAMVDVLTVYAGFEVVAATGTAEGLADVAAQVEAHLVVLDVRMPGGGPPAARALRSRPPYPVVVAVSASTDVSTVAEMMRAGATGFLAKGSLGTTFADDLSRCAQGQVMVAVPQGAQVLRTLGATSPDASED
jgi:DNA-binding NarL/FixJ family response regulator